MLVPDGTRSFPLPSLIRAVHRALHGRASRLTVLVALGTHAPMERRRARRPPGVHRAGPRRRLPGHRGPQPRVVEAGDLRPSRHHSRGTDRGAVRGPAQPRGGGAAEPGRRRPRHRAGRRAGPPARGRRHVRRQQVLLPRRRRAADHRRLALARRAHHLGRDHRHDRPHAGARADRRGRGPDPGGEVRLLRGDGRSGRLCRMGTTTTARPATGATARTSSRAWRCTRSRSATVPPPGPARRRSVPPRT